MLNKSIKLSIKQGVSLLAFILFTSVAVSAQRIAYIDVNKIMNSIDEYSTAQKELDRVAAKWRQEIAQNQDEIKGMYNKYQAEQVLLSDEARRKREDEIIDREKSLMDLQKSRFGPEGELFKRRKELVQPIQDKVFTAIEDFANERGYDFVFDISSGSSGLIFFNPEYDKTEDVLNRLK